MKIVWQSERSAKKWAILPVQSKTLMRHFESIRSCGQPSSFAPRFIEARVNTNWLFRTVTKRSDNTRAASEASLLRASTKVHLGKYADALKEFNYLISLHPRPVTLARALSDRAWFQATCPDPAFRNGKQAVKDAKAACSIMQWKDEDMIDTLAAAYAETGDFASATRYAAQALTIKDIPPRDANRIQHHLTLFQRESTDSIITLRPHFDAELLTSQRYTIVKSCSFFKLDRTRKPEVL